jgi:GR25 family glycosyltransferase involved in LPS biosynthesis
MLNKYFDKVFIINVPTATQRLEKISGMCANLGIDFELVSAYTGKDRRVKMLGTPTQGWNRNAAALAKTTVKILKQAKKAGLKNIFILEDDAEFISVNAEAILHKSVKNLPETWDFFHLNVLPIVPSTWVNSCLERLNGAWCCQAYGVNHTVYDLYIERLQAYNRPIDEITAEIHKERQRSYATSPCIVTHKEGEYSTLREYVVEY